MPDPSPQPTSRAPRAASDPSSPVITSPISSRSVSTEIAPGRSTVGGDVVQSTTVDSTPASVRPPVRMQAMRPSRSCCTACQVVGLGRPDRFAEGAATGVSHASRNDCARGCRGQRSPTVESPAVTTAGTASDFGRMTVSGPGQKRSMSARAAAGTRAERRSACSSAATCTIRGLSVGRPLAANIFCTASGRRASAPSPYTVSVGKAHSSPAWMCPAASSGEVVRTVVTLIRRGSRRMNGALQPEDRAGVDFRTVAVLASRRVLAHCPSCSWQPACLRLPPTMRHRLH